MHIPEGYISPQTCAVMWAGMVPFWVKAYNQVKKHVGPKQVANVALGSAFSFMLMMLNVPVLYGTTAHAVGAALVAILLGPWAAVLSVSIALLVQALMFGDGGVLAFGANAFAIALVAPWVGYFIYRLLSRSVGRLWASMIGAYFSINAAALVVAVLLGIQPLLFKDAAGLPAYFPFSLAEAVPAMMVIHITLAGFVEALFTGLVLWILQKWGQWSGQQEVA
ncbi:cobalt transporter CbiM [Coprothermobacteraceae bacterium]|nr:cobalt transporter CbiM [Coprothermobacteraceae bacterium]